MSPEEPDAEQSDPGQSDPGSGRTPLVIGANSWIVDATVKRGRPLDGDADQFDAADVAPSSATQRVTRDVLPGSADSAAGAADAGRAAAAPGPQSSAAGPAAGDDAEGRHDLASDEAAEPRDPASATQRVGRTSDADEPGAPATQRAGRGIPAGGDDADDAYKPGAPATQRVGTDGVADGDDPADATRLDASRLDTARAAAPGWTPGETTVLPAGDLAKATREIRLQGPHVYDAHRRANRTAMILSTLLGTLGLVVAALSALLDLVRYNQAAPCAVYSATHNNAHAFGCSVTARHVAAYLPGFGIPLLVLVFLAITWIPQHTPRGRMAWLGAYFVVLLLCAGAVGIAFSALPHNS